MCYLFVIIIQRACTWGHGLLLGMVFIVMGVVWCVGFVLGCSVLVVVCWLRCHAGVWLRSFVTDCWFSLFGVSLLS